MSNYLKRIQSEQLSGYTKQLTEVVEQYEPKNILQGLLCSNADKGLLEQLKYKKDQMEALARLFKALVSNKLKRYRARDREWFSKEIVFSKKIKRL